MRRRARTTELLLLAAATPLVLLVFALVKAAARDAFVATDLIVPGALVGAFLVAHVALRLRAPDAEPTLLPIVLVLTGLGLAFVTRLDPKLAVSQTEWIAIGAGALVATVAWSPSLESLARYKYTIMLAAIALLVLPVVAGVEINGARLWLRFAGLSFQPGEIAKVLVVLFLAAYLSEKKEVLSISTRRVLGMGLPPARQLGPLLAVWAVSLFVLVAERDLGSSLLFFGVFLVMIYVATGRKAYVVVGAILFAIGATGAYFAFHHVATRVDIWLHPFADAAGRGYQLVQALFAMAAGGVGGVGIGKGLPTRIPYVATDFIFTAIGEEIGLLGAAAVIIAYLVWCFRGLAVAARSRSDMASLTALGLVTTVGLQAFVIIGGVTRLIPLTGITLPFISYGGSSILSNFILLGLLLRASDEATHADETPRERPSAGDVLAADLTSDRLSPLTSARRLSRISWGLAVLYVALVANLTWIQVVHRQALVSNPANSRGFAAAQTEDRGRIVTRDGVVLAESVPRGSRFVRRYPQGTLAAHVVGYFSTRYGATGIEAAAGETLTGHRAFKTFADVIDAAAGVPVPGNDVVLTIDSRVQRAAEKALGSRRGSVVVLDPRDGAVLAMASNPRYDPAAVDAAWRRLNAPSAGSPLVDRAIASVYPPGSTFKVVTLTAALADGVATTDSLYRGPAMLMIGGARVTNFESGAYGEITLRKATMSSVNTVFGQVAAQLGPKRLVGQADAFGFDTAPPLELSVKESVMSPPSQMSEWETAWAGCGQPVVGGAPQAWVGPVATPLQMALVAAGIANKGVVDRPYLIAGTRTRAGRTLSATIPRAWKTATDPGTAATVEGVMVDVVKGGSGVRAALPHVTVAGKTGTAEVGGTATPHAWFLGLAPADSPSVAMAIVLENAGVGGRVAAPAARGVLEAALIAQGVRP